MSNGQMWKCQVCKTGGDVYNMANFVEGMPVGTTVDFWLITVPHVADCVNFTLDIAKYHEALKELSVDPAKMKGHVPKETRKQIDDIIHERKDPDRINGEYNRKYPEQIRNAISDTFGVFFPQKGDLEFLGRDHPLNDDRVIKDGNLVFPIHNVYNALLGFMCRLPEKEIAEAGVKKYKFTTTLIEGESIGLFNMNRARQTITETKLVYMFESQFDCMVAYVSGLTNSVSIGTSPEIEKLVKLLNSYKVAEIVLILDNDRPGHFATVKIAEQMVERGISVSVFLLPSKVDADEYIVEFGVGPLQNSGQRMTLAEYALKVGYDDLSNLNLSVSVRYLRALEYLVRFSRTLGSAVTYAKQISDMFDIKSPEDVRFDIAREMANFKDPVTARYNTIVQNAVQQIISEPDVEKKDSLVENTLKDLKTLQQSYATHSRSEEARELDEILTQGQENTDIVHTGIGEFDDAVRLTLGTFLIMGGRASSGKSSLVRAIVCNALRNDPELFIIHCTLDDTKKDTMDGIISNLSGVENSILEQGLVSPELMPRIEEAQQIVRNWWGSQYYMVGQGKIQNTGDILSQIRRVRARHESKKILLIVDNLMNLPEVSEMGQQNKRVVTEIAVNRMQILTQAELVATICMVELTKSGPYRPDIGMLKETGSIEYRAKIVALLHNDLKLTPNSTIAWKDENGSKRPVLEIDFPKYKVGEPNRKLWLCMNPAVNRFSSPTESQIKNWAQVAATQMSKKAGGSQGGEGKQGSSGGFDD